MTVGIQLRRERVSSKYVAPFHTVYGENMAKALNAAHRYCWAHELAGEGPDTTVYAYDCLGGLRFEARRRNNRFTLIKT